MSKIKLIRGGVVLGILTLLIWGYLRLTKTYTDPITDQSGNVIENSIAFFDKIQLGGMDQQILIRGNNINNPVILFLHGGPGAPDMPMVRFFNGDLEKSFTMVTWDQRGCGKSYSEEAFDSNFTMDQFVSDAKELTDYLKKTLNKDKIYLIGHSWGSLIGMKLIEKHPQDFVEYLSISQVVDMAQSENYSYAFVKEQIEISGDQELKDAFSKIGVPQKGKYPGGVAAMMKQRDLLLKLGGVLKKYTDYAPMIEAFQEVTETNYPDFMKLQDAFSTSTKHLWSEIVRLNIMKTIPEVKVPVHFVYGKDDKIVNPSLIRLYKSELIAPKKTITEFENCAHFPQIEDNKRFNELIMTLWSTKN
ncbi:MAG: hypothetical protein COA88_02395 [Kordia sp.]|nr:MAG: hypothetical protein COA88_02395 [Kordia sp.]